jgi:hypothetical protein
MEIRTIAALGLCLALTAPTLAADKPKAAAKPAPAASESKDAKPDTQGVKSAGPHLRMADAPAKNPGKDRDMRHCLDLPTPKEVIRCSEGK